MTDHLPVRSITVAGRRTSVRLHDSIWAPLNKISEREGVPLSALLTKIDRQRGRTPLTTAIRNFVVEALRQRDSGPVSTLVARFHAAVGRDTETSDDTGFERKVRLKLDCMPLIEPERISRYWRQWRHLCSQRRRLPALDEFLARFRPKELHNIVDLSSDNPAHFQVIRVNPASIRFSAFDLHGRRVSQFPFAIHRDGMQADFNHAKTYAEPMYHLLEHRFRGGERIYSRLVLPFSSVGDRVDRVLSLVRPLSPSRPAD